jgi:hypothetical protein
MQPLQSVDVSGIDRTLVCSTADEPHLETIDRSFATA